MRKRLLGAFPSCLGGIVGGIVAVSILGASPTKGSATDPKVKERIRANVLEIVDPKSGKTVIELIGATHTIEEIREFLEADSVGYLSLDGMLSAVKNERSSYCTSCYTGVYPVAFPQDEATHLQLALKLDTKGEPVTR